VHTGEQLHRTDAPVPHSGVRGPPGHLQPERHGARARGDDPTGGGLGDDTCVPEVAAPQRGPRPEAAVLLVDDAVEGHGTDQAHPRRPDRGEGGQGGHDAGLHVARPAAVDRPTGQAGHERVAGPEGAVAGWDDVGVPGEDEGGTAVPVAVGSDDAPRLGPLDLLTGGIRSRRGLGQVDRPAVDVAVQLLEPAGELVLDLALGGGTPDRRDGDHPAEPIDHPFLVDGGQDPGLGVRQDPGLGVRQDPGLGVCQDPGLGVCQDPGLGVGQVGHGRSLACPVGAPGG
jgi:hypothetical protein